MDHHQPLDLHAPHQGDDNDDSDASDHDTDTMSDTKMNHSPDSTFTDAHAEVLGAFKGADCSVMCWRVIVKVIMVCIAVTITAMTYVQLSQSEKNEFEASFNLYSEGIRSYSNFEMRALAESAESLADTITIKGLQNTTTGQRAAWPYVSSPVFEFAHYAEHVTSFSRNSFIATTPIVQDVAAWDLYNAAVLSTSNAPFNPEMYVYGKNGKLPVNGTGPFLPIHHVYTEATSLSNISNNVTINNFDTSSDLGVAAVATMVSNVRHAVLTGFLSLTYFRDSYPEIIDASEPLSMYVRPIYNTFEQNTSEVVGYLQSLFQWKIFLSKFNEIGVDVVCVIANTCGDHVAFILSNNSVHYVSDEDARIRTFDGISTTLEIGTDDIPNDEIESAKGAGVCIHTLTIYPTLEFRQTFNANAVLYSMVIGVTMLTMVGAFFAYDIFVKRRNDKVIKAAVRSSAIVASMFPSNVRDRLYEGLQENEKKQKKNGNLKTYLRDNDGKMISQTDTNNAPLADFFTDTTVLFADIAGFTAWSSVREPNQVFILLETLYAAFDAIAKMRRIFKVETIGDCYVAVSGLPEPRADHAMIMSKFANDIMATMRTLTRDLEATLGPDTGDLTLRIGLHSGPVTAGVLRGERARFQLFGDTMNTAARMEQTGIKNRIQVSQSTADCLVAGGKSHWLRLRDEKVVAKGKGELTTYWLEVKSTTSGTKSSCSSGSRDETSKHSATDREDNCHIPYLQRSRKSKQSRLDKIDRLIDWNTDNLLRSLQQVLNNRQGNIERDDTNNHHISFSAKPFEEVKEIISLPQVKKHKIVSDESLILVSKEVSRQLRDYVSNIAYMYNDNFFHNFEHASHVTMSVTKLLSRIVAPSDVLDEYRDRANKDLVSTLHDHTYGITSDPLTQFACAFSALIHDVDHAGVPNSQLVNENKEMALRFDGKSVAEQNSIDLAWKLLMTDEYAELRNAICATESDLFRFRQLIVNAVMATDIMDKDLKNIRNMRWSKAFTDVSMEATEATTSPQDILDQVNRKATIVIEHIIQASDVSHTMQHWYIYRKWNELFYFECYDAYVHGRAMVDPTDTWYQGELDFYDYYIIPLANKLKECGVFGVSSTEYLQYAKSNRSEWHVRGKEIVAEMKERFAAMEQKE